LPLHAPCVNMDQGRGLTNVIFESRDVDFYSFFSQTELRFADQDVSPHPFGGRVG